MAPVLFNEDHFPTSMRQDSRGIDVNLISAIVASITLIVVLFGICGCCGREKKEDKEEKNEPKGPKYMEMDFNPDAHSRKSATAGQDEPVKSKRESHIREGRSKEKEKAARYLELEPPPVMPFKTEMRSIPQTLSGKDVPREKKSEKTPLKESSKKAPEKGKEPAIQPVVSEIKKPAVSKEPPVTPKVPAAPIQFAQEDDPRYRSLYQLDDIFEGTIMKTSLVNAKTAIMPPRVDGNVSMSAAPSSRSARKR